MNEIEKFCSYDYGCSYGKGYGNGYGSGGGNGNGNGYSNGSGGDYGNGYGSGSGHGDDCGYSHGYGRGVGYSNGSCNVDGNGCGNGNDYNRDIKSFNGKTVYYIDNIPTIITKVKRNVAKGFILNSDLTTTPCYIVKSDDIFAHGATLAEAREALRDKLFKDMGEDERIDAFLDEFNLTDKYPAKEFFDWHNRLTGSCKMGREAFVKNHGINLNNDSFTVAEFCELCKNDYGGNIIRRIMERI